MSTDPTSTPPPLSVRFARRSTRGLFLGFSTPRVAAFGCATVIAVAALFVGGPMAFIASGLVWLPLGAVAFVRVAGRPAVEWAGTAGHFGARRVGGQTEFRSRVEKPRPAGTLALPGDAASMRLHVDGASGAVMIHDPHRQTLCAVLSVSHPAFALLDDPDRSLRVSRWGRVIAQLAHSGTCAALQVLEATIPDPARNQSDWWETHGRTDAGWASSQYRALLDQVRLDSSTHRTTISLSLDLRAAARAVKAAGRGVRGAAEVLRADMASLTDALRQAGLRPVGWLDEAELAAIVRQAFEPSVEIDPTSDPAANLAHAGPVAVSESWHRLRHDSSWSSVLWVSEWPRIAVPPDFLHPLVFAPGVRRTLSITSRPQPTDAALRQIRREKTEAIADSAQKARVGQLADLSDSQEYDDLMARERSVISGHTDVEFTGLVTVTAPTAETLDAVDCHDHAGCRAGELRGPAPLRTPDAGLHRRRSPSRADDVLMGDKSIPEPSPPAGTHRTTAGRRPTTSSTLLSAARVGCSRSTARRAGPLHVLNGRHDAQPARWNSNTAGDSPASAGQSWRLSARTSVTDRSCRRAVRPVRWRAAPTAVSDSSRIGPLPRCWPVPTRSSQKRDLARKEC